ncbi:MAG: FtsW/RodA/SpoVE family cell cycle protein [Eubacteriales bacterium]
MEHIIVVLSKYIMVGMIVLFTIESCILVARQGKKNNFFLLGTQIFLIFAYHFMGFITLVIQKEDMVYVFLYVFEVILIFAMLVLFKAIYSECNQFLMNNMCMLFALGSVILARLSLSQAVKQFVIMVIAFMAAMVIPYLLAKFRIWRELGFLCGAVGIFVLGVVLVVGSVTNGSKLSYTLFDITFQPSEVVKILFIFFLACFLWKADKFHNVVIATVGAAIHVLILVLSKDLGSALIYYVAYVIMLYVATRKELYLLTGISAATIGSYIAYQLFTHVQVRVEAWLDPWNDINDTGYQITQSLFAIGTGGWFGLGLQEGTPKSIPLVETDFIFSAISEEMGAITGICLIIISFTCFLIMLYLTWKVEDKFYGLIALGIGTTYLFQTFLTIGGGTKFIPLTGVTLPFISYGGTSVLATVIMFIIVQGVDLAYKEQEKLREKTKRKTTKVKRPTKLKTNSKD